MAHPVLLYDGVCRFCNRLLQFVLRHDDEKIFRFASLQSSFGSRVLTQHSVDASQVHCRFILTDKIEATTVGNTILISKGLIDTMPRNVKDTLGGGHSTTGCMVGQMSFVSAMCPKWKVSSFSHNDRPFLIVAQRSRA
jgi:hypothetical protein